MASLILTVFRVLCRHNFQVGVSDRERDTQTGLEGRLGQRT